MADPSITHAVRRTGRHRHDCSRCFLVWEHEDTCAAPFHTALSGCPGCRNPGVAVGIEEAEASVLFAWLGTRRRRRASRRPRLAVLGLAGAVAGLVLVLAAPSLWRSDGSRTVSPRPPVEAPVAALPPSSGGEAPRARVTPADHSQTPSVRPEVARAATPAPPPGGRETTPPADASARTAPPAAVRPIPVPPRAARALPVSPDAARTSAGQPRSASRTAAGQPRSAARAAAPPAGRPGAVVSSLRYRVLHRTPAAWTWSWQVSLPGKTPPGPLRVRVEFVAHEGGVRRVVHVEHLCGVPVLDGRVPTIAGTASLGATPAGQVTAVAATVTRDATCRAAPATARSVRSRG